MPQKRPASHAAINSNNVGFKLLKKAGWEEGTGLGASNQGPKEPLQLPVQVATTGLGFATAPDATRQQAAKTASTRAANSTSAAAAAADSSLGAPGQRIGPKQAKADVSEMVKQELASESTEQKVALHTARMRAERKAARDRAIQAQVFAAFNAPSTSDTADVNPLLRKHNPLTATNPLLD